MLQVSRATLCQDETFYVKEVLDGTSATVIELCPLLVFELSTLQF